MIGLRFTDGVITLNVSDLINGLLSGYMPGNMALGEKYSTDSAYVVLMGVKATKLATIAALNRFFRQAQERWEKPFLPKIYVEMDNGDGVWWRSEVVEGSIMLSSESIDRIDRSPEVTLFFRRDNFWEGAEAQLPLSNGNGSNNTAGLTVYNCNDGSGSSPNIRHNYVQISGTDVTGDLLAPVRLELTNTFNDATRLYTIWMGHNAEADPANFQHWLEGEAVSYGGSDVVSASYSGGKYRTFTWAGDNPINIGRWTLDTTFLNRAGGKWFKALCAFVGNPGAGFRLQLKVTFPAGTPLTVVGSSQEVSIDQYARLQDIATLQIPPWLVGSGDLTPVDLSLYARRSGGGSIMIDYMQLTPLDSYRILQPQGYGTSYTIRIVDDGINETLYTDGWSPSGKTGHYVGIGSQIQLKPGKTQRIIFLQKGITGDISIARTLSIKAFYRPRKATL